MFTIPNELLTLLILSMFLSLLLFWTNYRANVRASRNRYSENGRFSYPQLILDAVWAVSIGAMGCVGMWHSMDTWDWFQEYIQYKEFGAVVIGGMMQQLVPIGQELIMGQARNVASRFKAGDYQGSNQNYSGYQQNNQNSQNNQNQPNQQNKYNRGPNQRPNTKSEKQTDQKDDSGDKPKPGETQGDKS